MKDCNDSSVDQVFVANALEATIRIVVLGLLLVWCFKIGRPFIEPITWGIIIAVAIDPLHRRLTSALGGRGGLAATLITLFALAILVIPTILLGGSLTDTAQHLSAQFKMGALNVPAPPESVKTWPVVGEHLYEFWVLAADNLEATLSKMGPQIKMVGEWLLTTAKSVAAGIVKFIVSIIISGALLVHSIAGQRFARSIATRLAGERGIELADLAGATVRSVAQGVLGVAIIQAILAGIGLLAANVPGAGFWALLVLFCAVVQIPPLLVLGPIIVYVFSTSGTTTAVVFAIWSIFVGTSDTFLKPLLFGRSVQVPMLVVLLGAIGGMMLSGIMGLFLGPVILVLGYQLFEAWLKQGSRNMDEQGVSNPSSADAPLKPDNE